MKKNLAYAILSGLLLAGSWPTYGVPLLLFFGFVPLLLVEHTVRAHKFHKRTVFFYSYLTFLIWNSITTWWIFGATPVGMFIAILANSLLMSLVILLYHIVARRTTFQVSVIFLVCIWMSFEYMHLHWDFSWPWLNLGNGFANWTSWIQWYEYTGTFGGTLWIWIVNILIFKSILQFRKYHDTAIIYRMLIKNGLIIGIPLVISIILLKAYVEEGERIEVVIIQPNINPYTEKYTTTDQRVGTLLDSLTKHEITEQTDFVIAPETVFADNIQMKQFPYSIAKRTASKIIGTFPKVSVLSGISMVDVFEDPSRVHAQSNVYQDNVYFDDYNSAFFVRPDGSTELYHKSKLVVGVENFPYQGLLKPILGDAMIDLGGTVAKKTTQPDREVFFTKDSIGAAPIICYESVYGEFVTGYVRNRADFLAIITNDAWWGNTQGHRQHLAYAKLRAIETRRSVARSANTGISAIIDQTGDVVQKLGYEKQGIIKGTLSTNNKITFYVMAGNYLARIAVFLMIFIFLYAVTRRRKPII